MSTGKNVFAIIVTYNGSRWFEKCLLSLQKSTVPLRIVVIDNNSSDDTVSIIQNTFLDIELISSKKNLGFGAANNIGFKMALEANADYVFLLNQDAWINDKTVELLLNAATKNSEYGILSPFHYNYAGDAPEQYFREWVMRHYTHGLENDYENGSMDQVYPTSFVHAACWLIPMNTIKEVGGFDPLFYHYGEDNDYIQRLSLRNKMVGIVPAACVFHKGSNEGLKSPGKNIPFLVNQSLLVFKDPNASTKGAVLLFLKQLVKKNLSEFKSPLAKALRFNLMRLPKMMRSKGKQKLPLAYLES